MKKILLLFFVSALSFSVLSQSISFSKPIIVKEGPLENKEVDFYSYIVNNTSKTVNLTWVRYQNNLPSGWSSKICDDILCYDSSVSTSSYGAALAPGDSTFMIGYIAMDGVTQGSGEVKVVVYDPIDSLGTAGEFHFQYNAWPLSVKDPVKADVKIYPNPAKNMLHIENLVAAVDRVELYDITGKYIASQKRVGEKIAMDISNLTHGTYFIRIIGMKNESLQVKMIQKIK